MDLLENSKMSLLNFKSVMIYIIHKILGLLKNHPNYLKDSIFECFLKSAIVFYFFKIFSITYNNGKFKSRKRN